MIQRYKCRAWSHDDEGGKYKVRRTPNANGDYVLYVDHVARVPVKHDLRKEPNDLPDTERHVLCVDDFGCTYIDRYIREAGRWNGTEIPVAWQELPDWE